MGEIFLLRLLVSSDLVAHKAQPVNGQAEKASRESLMPTSLADRPKTQTTALSR